MVTFFHLQVHQSISNVTGGGSVSIGVDGGTTSRHESTKGNSFSLLSVSIVKCRRPDIDK